MTDIPIAERIAAVQLEVRRMEDCQGDWRLYLEKLSPESVGYKSATISLEHLARLRAVLATLQSHERLQAEHERAMKVVEAAREVAVWSHEYVPFFPTLHTAIAAYDAALSPPAEETENG